METHWSLERILVQIYLENRFVVIFKVSYIYFQIRVQFLNATADGLFTEGTCGRYNLTDRTIIFRICEGLEVNCGDRNKLSSVSQTGGDSGGGNVEVTYSYTNFNDFTVTHIKDPAAGNY